MTENAATSPPPVPTVDVPASIYDPALAWCNERRAEKGMESLPTLPAGVPHDTTSCPCAEACGVRVGHTRWSREPGDTDYEPDNPKHGLTFPNYFDDHARRWVGPVLPLRVPDSALARATGGAK